MTLQSLTEDDVNALMAYERVLGHGVATDEDIVTCDARGWIHIDVSERAFDGGLAWSLGDAEAPDALLAEAKSIYDGLSDHEARASFDLLSEHGGRLCRHLRERTMAAHEGRRAEEIEAFDAWVATLNPDGQSWDGGVFEIAWQAWATRAGIAPGHLQHAVYGRPSPNHSREEP